MQLPGIGAINAMIVLSAIGDISRFPTAKHLVGYSGLGISIHASGQTQHTGGITKQGRREIRTTLVEAAWVAVAHHPHWKAVFERLCTRMKKRKAIVAVARKLLIVIWHGLAEQVADRSAEVEAVARKLLLWGTAKGVARRLNGSRGIFVRRQLNAVGVRGRTHESRRWQGSHRLTVGRLLLTPQHIGVHEARTTDRSERASGAGSASDSSDTGGNHPADGN